MYHPKYRCIKRIIPIFLATFTILFFYTPFIAKAETLFSQPNSNGYLYYEYTPFGFQGFTFSNDNGGETKLTTLVGSNMPSYPANFSYPGYIFTHPIATTTQTSYVDSITLYIRDLDKTEFKDYGLQFRCVDGQGGYHGFFNSGYVNSSQFSADEFVPIEFKFLTPNCDLSKYHIRWIIFANEIGGLGGTPIQVRMQNTDSINGFGISNENGSLTEEYESQIIIKNIYPVSKNPVLIIPGVLGTEMKNGDEILWASILRMLNPFNSDSFMDDLKFEHDMFPSTQNVHPNKIIDNPDGLFDYSEGLINELKNQGYKENTDLFTFPYDWRYGISGKYEDGTTTVDLLKQKVQEIISQTRADKINVIAHSTGGLLVKKYVMQNPKDHKIDKAVMVGVPNLGAPKAVKTLLQGDNFDVVGLNDEEMKKIAENLPVVYDLAPTSKYYDLRGSFIKRIEQKFLARDLVKNLNFAESAGFLLEDHGLNAQAYQNAQNLHNQDFLNYDLRVAGVNVYNLVGCGSGTIGQVVELRSKDFYGNYIYSYRKPKTISGDETVPFESADSIETDLDKEFYIKKISHSALLSSNGSRQLIVNLISGSNLDMGSRVFSKPQILSNPELCQIKGDEIEIRSPLDIEVLDQYGNRLGFASDGSLQNNIPGADFNVFGDHKFVYLPKDEGETYSINLQGTGQGTFTLGIDDIDDNNITQTQNFISVPVSTSTLGILNLNSPQVSLSLDTNGDGSIDQNIEPTSVLDQNQAQDLVAPVSTSTIAGLMGEEGYYRSDVNISLSAQDPVIAGYESETSGVLQLNYRLDNAEWQTSTSNLSSILPSPGEEVKQTLTFTAEGAHTLSFYAVDRAGNNELPQTITFTIDKTSPELSFQFDPNANDLAFTVADNISTTSTLTLLDSDNIITAKDQAGNSIELKFKEKDRKKKLKAELLSLSYNGQAADTNKTELKFAWEKEHRALSQHIKSKKDFNIEAEYKVKTNQTKLEGKDQNGKIKQTLPGLVLLTVATNKGDLEWGY